MLFFFSNRQASAQQSALQTYSQEASRMDRTYRLGSCLRPPAGTHCFQHASTCVRTSIDEVAHS